jgi:hypothetical protein
MRRDGHDKADSRLLLLFSKRVGKQVTEVQTLYSLNSLDITLKFHITATFVIAGLQTIFHILYGSQTHC